MKDLSKTISNLLSKTPTIVPIAPNGMLLYAANLVGLFYYYKTNLVKDA